MQRTGVSRAALPIHKGAEQWSGVHKGTANNAERIHLTQTVQSRLSGLCAVTAAKELLS
jgi:hypothetical protein